MDTVIFSSPIMWALVAIVSFMHVVSAVIGISKKSWTYVLIAVNAVAHIAFFVVALIIGAKSEEIFLAIMISATVGMLSVFISEKIAPAPSESADAGEEEEHGI